MYADDTVTPSALFRLQRYKIAQHYANVKKPFRY